MGGEATILSRALEKGDLLPLLAERHPDLKEGTAYRIQRAFVEKRLKKDRVSGFKAGLTTEASRSRYKVEAPLSGILLLSMKRAPSLPIEKDRYKKLMLETEIALIVGKPITRKVKNVAQLKRLVRGLAPAIELPDLYFADMENLTGFDLITGALGKMLPAEKGDYSAEYGPLGTLSFSVQ